MRTISMIFFMALLLLTALPSLAQKKSSKQPNILFLLTDDQRADTIHALGNKFISTPNMDRLVSEGTTFTRAYCMGAQQGAVCVPSRAMMLSGKSLFRIKENLNGETTWPQVFAQNGYATFAVGKWHNGEESMIRSFATGKNIFFGGMSDPFKMPVQNLTENHQIDGKHVVGKHATEVFADTAIEFLQQKREQPFALYIAFTLPHDPRLAPKEYRAKYDSAKLPVPQNFLPQHPFDNGELLVRDERLAPWPRTKDIIRSELADYYACVTYLDMQIGRILEALKQSGQTENTVIVFASDHGLALGSHGLLGKQNLYEHSMHAPLILAGPRIPKGKKSDAFCYLLDLFPTMCDLAEIQIPASVEGTSLMPVLAGKQKTLRNTIFTAYRNVQRAIRDDRWKLIVYPQINKIQLFDLKNDPNELHDLSGDPKFSAQVEKMLLLLKKQQAEFGDQQPLRVEKPQPAEFDFTKIKN